MFALLSLEVMMALATMRNTRTIRIDPRDFMMTPYLRCPRCGAEEYGVLSVRDTRCKRRCRACWHTATIYLPEIKKKIVYFDQFAFSNIMKFLSPDRILRNVRSQGNRMAHR
jgi:transcription elongation factor Elf1